MSKQHPGGQDTAPAGLNWGGGGGPRPCLHPPYRCLCPASPLPFWSSVSVSINNLYPGCENVSVRSRSMMFEPGLTKGVLEVFVAPSHHPHCSADDQSTKAIDIQNAYLNGMCQPSRPSPPSPQERPKLAQHPLSHHRDASHSPEGACALRCPSHPQGNEAHADCPG